MGRSRRASDAIPRREWAPQKKVWAFADALPGQCTSRCIAASQGAMQGRVSMPPIAGQRTPTGLPEARSAREYPKSVINRNSGSSGTRETRAVSRATDSGGFGDPVIRTRCVPVRLALSSLFIFFSPGKEFSSSESIGGAFRGRAPGSWISDVNSGLDVPGLGIITFTFFFLEPVAPPSGVAQGRCRRGPGKYPRWRSLLDRQRLG